jgi:hypothetical protein
VTDPMPPRFDMGEVTTACVAQHEWFDGLCQAGFARWEALYIVTRPSVEMTRCQWVAANGERGQPL